MKIYTGTGDSGKTSLFSGERLSKDDLRVETYGSVDEVCSFIGVIESSLPDCAEKVLISDVLQDIQGDLFVIGALLATSPESGDANLLTALEGSRVEWLEKIIDEVQKNLGELHSFILPGGHPAAAWCHVVRTVCRRSERNVVSLAKHQECMDSERVLSYMNRLSDFFFVLARYVNSLAGTEEKIWHG